MAAGVDMCQNKDRDYINEMVSAKNWMFVTPWGKHQFNCKKKHHIYTETSSHSQELRLMTVNNLVNLIKNYESRSH